MSQKNETTILVLSILITAGLIAGGFWWFSRKSGVDLNPINSGSTKTPQAVSEQLSGKTFASIQYVPTGLFNYGGSTSWAPIRLVVDSPIQAARPEFRLRYVEPSECISWYWYWHPVTDRRSTSLCPVFPTSSRIRN